MNISVDDKKLQADEEFQKFLKDNPGRGYLKIRANYASEALPVSGVSIVVSKEIGLNNVVFFTGQTDNSGMINGIVLPTPSKNNNNLEAPLFTDYIITAKYNDFEQIYKIALCCSVSVIQYINIVPNNNIEGEVNGS